MKPLCFVIMPFGIKTDGNKKEINFDIVYLTFIKPAVQKAGLEPIRADEEKTGGFIHKPMYERLMFCDFAVADLSFANANVFYELGIRHALKPYTTISIYEVNTKLPFDTSPLRTFPYDYENGKIEDLTNKIQSLCDKIKFNLTAQKAQNDSPIGNLIAGYKFPDLEYLQSSAEAFAEEMQMISGLKESINQLVKVWKDLEKSKTSAAEADQKTIVQKQNEVFKKIYDIEEQQGDSLKFNYGLLYTFLDAYKAVDAFEKITDLLKPLISSTFKNNIYLNQQLALAYNKTKKRDEAKTILEAIIEQYGPDPETNGLLGAVLKGLMDDNENDPDMQSEYCNQAIQVYLQGFESDPRNYYPGVNALTLLFLSGGDNEKFNNYYPLVSFAVERMLSSKAKDYWVQAAALELATLGSNEKKAIKYLSAALTCSSEKWMRKTTYNNLQKIHSQLLKSKNETALTWLDHILDKLKVDKN